MPYQICVYTYYNIREKTKYYFVRVIHVGDELTALIDHLNSIARNIAAQQYWIWQQLHRGGDVELNTRPQKSRDDVSMALRQVCNMIRQADDDVPVDREDDLDAIYDEFITAISQFKGQWQFINIRLLLDWKRYAMQGAQIAIIGTVYDLELDAIDGLWRQCASLYRLCDDFDQVCCSIFDYGKPRDDLLQRIYTLASACIRCGHSSDHPLATCRKKDIRCLARPTLFNISCSICGLFTHSSEQCTVSEKRHRYPAFYVDDDD